MESNKSLEDYVIADIPRLAHKWNGNIVGGIMVELGHLHPAQVNADLLHNISADHVNNLSPRR